MVIFSWKSSIWSINNFEPYPYIYIYILQYRLSMYMGSYDYNVCFYGFNDFVWFQLHYIYIYMQFPQMHFITVATHCSVLGVKRTILPCTQRCALSPAALEFTTYPCPLEGSLCRVSRRLHIYIYIYHYNRRFQILIGYIYIYTTLPFYSIYIYIYQYLYILNTLGICRHKLSH